jgi:hypothetical protein
MLYLWVFMLWLGFLDRWRFVKNGIQFPSPATGPFFFVSANYVIFVFC